MRKYYLPQIRLDSLPVEKVELNLDWGDCIIPVLKALQLVYCNGQLIDGILALIGDDISRDVQSDTGRKRMDYWFICVLVGVWLVCDYTSDQLADLAENHRTDQPCDCQRRPQTSTGGHHNFPHQIPKTNTFGTDTRYRAELRIDEKMIIFVK